MGSHDQIFLSSQYLSSCTISDLVAKVIRPLLWKKGENTKKYMFYKFDLEFDLESHIPRSYELHNQIGDLSEHTNRNLFDEIWLKRLGFMDKIFTGTISK